MGLLYQKKNSENEEDGKTVLFTDFYHPTVDQGATPAKTEREKGDGESEETDANETKE